MAARKTVAVTERVHEDGLALLRGRDDIELHLLADASPVMALAVMAAAHAILVRIQPLGADRLAAARNLQIVSKHGVGCDNIDVAHLSARGIPVTVTGDANSSAVAEHVLMMMLALSKEALLYDRLTRTDRFADKGRHRTSELAGKTLLIIGFGRIGRKVAPLARAFGMRVLVADFALDKAAVTAAGCEPVDDFRAALPVADYLSLHVPLNDATRNFIGAAELAAMPDHAIVVNCARGGIIDEAALASALRAGTIAGAGLDVFADEPPAAASNPLLTLPNTILSPHNAATTIEAASRTAIAAAQNILDCFDGRVNEALLFNRGELG